MFAPGAPGCKFVTLVAAVLCTCVSSKDSRDKVGTAFTSMASSQLTTPLAVRPPVSQNLKFWGQDLNLSPAGNVSQPTGIHDQCLSGVTTEFLGQHSVGGKLSFDLKLLRHHVRRHVSAHRVLTSSSGSGDERFLGQQDGSVVRPPNLKAWNMRHGRREPAPESCPLSPPTWHTHTHSDTHTYTR